MGYFTFTWTACRDEGREFDNHLSESPVVVRQEGRRGEGGGGELGIHTD